MNKNQLANASRSSAERARIRRVELIVFLTVWITVVVGSLICTFVAMQ